MTSLQTADRVLTTLFLLADSGALTPRAIADKIGVSRGTAYNLLETLQAHGLAVQERESNQFRLGPAVYRLSSSQHGYEDLLASARPPMEHLRDLTRETVSLHVAVGGDRMSIARFESLHALRRVGGLGERFPLHAGAASHVLLAWAQPEEFDRLVGPGPLASFGANTITDPLQLRAELVKVKSQGYAIRREDPTAGVGGLSVPVFGPDGGILAVMTVTWPLVRWDDERIQEWIPSVLATASEITISLRVPST